jgi:hypothetical protein
VGNQLREIILSLSRSLPRFEVVAVTWPKPDGEAELVIDGTCGPDLRDGDQLVVADRFSDELMGWAVVTRTSPQQHRAQLKQCSASLWLGFMRQQSERHERQNTAVDVILWRPPEASDD